LNHIADCVLYGRLHFCNTSMISFKRKYCQYDTIRQFKCTEKVAVTHFGKQKIKI